MCCGSWLAGVLVLGAWMRAGAGGELPPGDGTQPGHAETRPVVAATVDDEPIYVHQVQRALAAAVGERPLAAEARPLFEAAALERLISRQLILKWLQSSGQAASEREVELAVQRLQRSLERQGSSLDEHCRRQGLDVRELHQAFEWQISWQRFLERYLTEENQQRYFERHRREFDGTRLRVAHILLKIEPPGDDERLAKIRAEAERIRAEILAGKRTFAQAASEYSAAPSAEEGGDLGYIGRREPMPETFSRAAFRLEPNEVSPPVVTAVGVHLITCLEVQPGQQTAQDAGPELARAAAQYLFQWAADRRRAEARIEFSGAVPHGGQELVREVSQTWEENR